MFTWSDTVTVCTRHLATANESFDTNLLQAELLVNSLQVLQLRQPTDGVHADGAHRAGVTSSGRYGSAVRHLAPQQHRAERRQSLNLICQATLMRLKTRATEKKTLLFHDKRQWTRLQAVT